MKLLVPTLPSNSSQKSCRDGSLINFITFDNIISEYIEKKQAFSHRLINSSDIPEITAGIREWLLKQIGCFITQGYIKPIDLNYWFSHETLLDEFDDLLLSFRDYLNQEHGLDTKEDYTLTRYKDSINFIITSDKLEMELDSLQVSSNIEEVRDIKRVFDKFEQELEDKFPDFNVRDLMTAMKGEHFEDLLVSHYQPN